MGRWDGMIDQLVRVLSFLRQGNGRPDDISIDRLAHPSLERKGRPDRSTTPATSYFIVYRRRPPTHSGLVAQAIQSLPNYIAPTAGRPVGVVGPVDQGSYFREEGRPSEGGEGRPDGGRPVVHLCLRDGRDGRPVLRPVGWRSCLGGRMAGRSPVLEGEEGREGRSAGRYNRPVGWSGYP